MHGCHRAWPVEVTWGLIALEEPGNGEMGWPPGAGQLDGFILDSQREDRAAAVQS